MDSNFLDALGRVLGVEGGTSMDSDDRGGLTHKGVTQVVYDEYRKQKNLGTQPVPQITNAEITDLYRTLYWNVAKCNVLPDGVDTIHFDMAVNAGPGQAAKLLQRAIGVTDDGIIGPETIAKVNGLDPRKVIGNYVEKRTDFYVDLVVRDVTQLKFLKGWIRRAISYIK